MHVIIYSIGMQELNATFYILVLLMSVVVHEVAHGFAAEKLGDPTARNLGRLTLNPLKHLDPIGSVLIPILLVISNAGFVFGWAKPVPYNPNNLRDKKRGTIIVAFAGVFANIILALGFSLIIQILSFYNIGNESLMGIFSIIVLINIVLAVFNLIPIPPLDGSKILFALLPPRFRYIEIFLEQYALIVLIFFIVFVWKYVSPLLFWLFHILTGF